MQPYHPFQFFQSFQYSPAYPSFYNMAPPPLLQQPTEIDPYSKNLSKLVLEYMERGVKVLTPEPLEDSNNDLPPINVNLYQLFAHFSHALSLRNDDSEIFLIKDSASEVMGGPPSDSWHLFVCSFERDLNRIWEESYREWILETTKNFIGKRVQDGTPPGKKAPALVPKFMKDAYKLNLRRTPFGRSYELGPRIIIEFSNDFLKNASTMYGWRISLRSGKAQCALGETTLKNQALHHAEIDVKQRYFVAANVPELFIPMLHALGHGASLNTDDHKLMQGQLEGISQEELQKLWAAFLQSHHGCLRTELIHYLNFLLLAGPFCEKVAQLGIDSLNNPSLRDIAQYIKKNPRLTPDFLNVLYGICLYQLMRPKQNKILHAFGMPFDKSHHSRPYAAFPCKRGICYLLLAGLHQKKSPKNIALRFFNSSGEFSNCALFKPILEVLGMDPLSEDQDMQTLMQGIISAWEGPWLRMILSNYYPHRDRSIPHCLIDAFTQKATKSCIHPPHQKMQNPPPTIRFGEVSLQTRDGILQPRSVCQRQVEQQNFEWLDRGEKKLPPHLIARNAPLSQLNQQWQAWEELVQASQGDHADFERIAAKMIDEWPAVKDNLENAQKNFITVLLHSSQIEHFARALSLALEAKKPIPLAIKQQMIEGMMRLACVEWPDPLTENARLFLQSLCQNAPIALEIMDSLLRLLRSLPATQVHLLARPLFEDSQISLASSLPINERPLIIHALTSSAIQKKDWMTAIPYHRWAKSHLTKEEYSKYSSEIKLLLKEELKPHDLINKKKKSNELKKELQEKNEKGASDQVKKELRVQYLLNKKATTDHLRQALVSAPKMLPLYQTLDSDEIRKIVTILFNYALDPEESFHHELVLLYQASKDSQLFSKIDPKMRRDFSHKLVGRICKSPLDYSSRYVTEWLGELETQTDFKNKEHLICLTQANYYYIKRLTQKVFFSSPEDRDEAVSTLMTHYKTHWIPLSELYTANGRTELAFQNTHHLCLHVLYIPYFCRMMREMVKGERAKEAGFVKSEREEKALNLPNSHFIDHPPFTLLPSDEQLVLHSEAFNITIESINYAEQGSTELEDRLCSLEGPMVLAPLIAHFLHFQVKMAGQLLDEFKQAPSPQKQKFAETSFDRSFKAIECVHACWKSLPKTKKFDKSRSSVKDAVRSFLNLLDNVDGMAKIVYIPILKKILAEEENEQP